MMKYYFEDINEQIKLYPILEAWLDTPFRHKCGVKGIGTDCIHFVARVFQEMGLVKWKKDLIPHYPIDWHLHNTREMLAEGIERTLNVEKFTDLTTPKMNGDILLFHFGKAASHASIFFDDYVYQALTDIGVKKIHISDRLLKRQMRFMYRILI